MTKLSSAEELHANAVVVDAHNDLLLSIMAEGVGPRGTFKQRWLGELRAGGVDVQVCPVYCDPEVPEAHLRQTLRMIAALKREVSESSDHLALCRTGGEIDAAVAAGKIALVLALEGTHALGPDETLVETFSELGVRMISFTHMGRTLLADGSGEDAVGSRLTQAGVAAVAEMERLGIVLDVSHLSAAGVEHALEIATRPLVASHSSARAVRDHHRNLTDDQLRGIAENGGVVGVNLLAAFISDGDATLDRVVDHYEHIADVAGVEHVGVGPDFVADIFADLYPADVDLTTEGLDPTATVPGLYASRHLPRLTAALLERGFSEGDVRLILGENFLRVFREVLGVQRG
jgi:membrane dipeptidase